MPELIFCAVVVYVLGWFGSILIFRSVELRRDWILLAGTFWPLTIAIVGLLMIPEIIAGEVDLF